ncbi:unnamed protein product [Clavelina lepadiformis]|uniref:Uncharacterized protein n=1 Tax=Clavelina lepadiformis TaxID=159417 RepID=A0ABP0FPC6_CLALP
MIWNKVLKGLASTMEHFIFAAKTGNLSAHPSVADKRSKIKWKQFIGQEFKGTGLFSAFVALCCIEMYQVCLRYSIGTTICQLCNFILMDFSVQYEHFTSTNGIYTVFSPMHVKYFNFISCLPRI